MYSDKDDNENEQQNMLAYKSMAEQMALLELIPNNNTHDENKNKPSRYKGHKSIIPTNKTNNSRLKNSSSILNNDSDNKQLNISNNFNNNYFNNSNINNNNNTIPSSKKNTMPYVKNRSNSSTVTYQAQFDKTRLSQKINKIEKNNIDNLPSKKQNPNNSISNESYGNEIPVIELIGVEKINQDEMDKETNKSVHNPFVFEKRIITKSRQYSIYEREMKNLKKKETKIKKIQGLIIKNKLKNLKSIPDMNKNSIDLVIKKGEYIPIENRAAQIHSQHLTQIILNEELNKMKKEAQEEKQMNEKIYKKYEPKAWNEFVEKCFQWKEEIYERRKEAENYRNKLDQKINYQPKINENSKKIMKKINKGNTSVDDVFTRLYNDYEEHKERQKDLEDKNLPIFSPKINNFRFSKNFGKNRKFRNKSFDNSYERFITDESKNNFFLDSQMTITDGRIKKKMRKALKYVNKNKQGNDYMKKNIPTQATNQTTLYMNTEKNIINKNKYKKYITTENNNITTETNLNTNQNYLPTDLNALTDENRIINEKKNNYFESIGEYEDINNQSNQSNFKKNTISNNNYSINESNREYNEERILKELNEAKLINKERLEKSKEESKNDESKNYDNSLYKINVMESTPQNIVQNVIIPSNKYQDFFDIEEINEL